MRQQPTSPRLRPLRLAVAALWVLGLAAPATGAGLSEEDLRSRIAEFVEASTGVPGAAVRVPALGAFTSAATGSEPVEVRLSARARPPFRGSFPVTVSLRRAGEEIKRGVVTAQLAAGRRGSAPASAPDLAPLARRGEIVRLRLQRGALRIEGRGRAREDCFAGRPARVVNLESRREIVGLVGADGVVHVQF